MPRILFRPYAHVLQTHQQGVAVAIHVDYLSVTHRKGLIPRVVKKIDFELAQAKVQLLGQGLMPVFEALGDFSI